MSTTVITQILTSLREGSEAGRVKTDERGNNVWDWNKGGGDELDIENTSILLSRLNNDKLSLVDDDMLNSEPELDVIEPDAGGGFNPYGVGTTAKKDPFRR